MDRAEILKQLKNTAPKVHCLTNPVTMQDMANVLLTAGGSAIMAQEPKEAAEITGLCNATLLNTGVPDEEKFRACILAGKRANELEHPVILDPVGAGASKFRRENMERLLTEVSVTAIRCNQEEASVLLRIYEKRNGTAEKEESRHNISGGVESAVFLEIKQQAEMAVQLAKAWSCVVLVSGKVDVVSDGVRTEYISGGDGRMRRMTGSGCMLSALCALFCGAQIPAFEAVLAAGSIWKMSSEEAGMQTIMSNGGMGSFHTYLFDALDKNCRV